MTDAPAFDLAETDRLLSTTRSVRRRLDLDRAVPAEVVVECLRLAVQAPTAGNSQGWRWLVVTDADKRAEVAGLYHAAAQEHIAWRAAQETDHQTKRVYDSALYLADVMAQVPVFVIPCVHGRVTIASNLAASSIYGSVIPAAWSFMLALRSRGLGTAWTTAHLAKEKEVADVLGIPYDEFSQIALLPVAYTQGTDFKPATRPPVEEITYWDTWGATR